MKKLAGIIAALVITFSVMAGNREKATTTFTVDTKASKVYWTGKKVSGEHTGYLLINDGTVKVSGNKVAAAQIEMNMNSIECTDLEGEWKDKLVAHLKNDDFFSVDKFPSAKFEITSINQKSGEDVVVGKLTIKGITHEISFPADINVANGKVRANGSAEIDRTKWDIKYGSGKFFSDLGDRMINDNFEIKFELLAAEQVQISAK